ncbi:beta-ketoacyl synthase N-terminal-like domain-containing protein, partial [Streptomyces sp. NPDC002133]|uniref:type I polyketide synthase n=1 Tax=Streptomyces sp. NPDC002133 TaxID=3154409 RepID=UPI0033294D5D
MNPLVGSVKAEYESLNALWGSAVEHNDSIAVVGLSCRLPGAADHTAFWELLHTGSSAVSEAPEGRWAPEAGVPTGLRGGFLDGVEDFDAGFFGISPREAAAMDPQQRLVLELTWEALEDAGIVPSTLRDTPTSVFVGTLRDDYAGLLYQYGTKAVTQHTMTGVNRGVIANRVSYHLGLRGPSLTVDAAQSSSLVAVHLACESLRSGESATAVAVGVNLNLLAENVVTEERFGALSPDGTTYAFDARANGFVPGEGCAVVILKPLARALADGDRIHGVIRAGAVNNDGATEVLTRPSAAAQEQVLRLAYERAGVDPRAVQYVELHGTGTPVGDPVEAAALGAALGAGRDADSALRVGSVKTNIGHLEGAAGIAGLVKVLLALSHRELPPSLNFETPNPRIPLPELGLAVQRELSAWPHPDRELIAGVSSFGMGGTNCHLVVSEAPDTERSRAGESAPAATAAPAVRAVPAAPAFPAVTAVPAVLPWVISGQSDAALRAQAERLTAHVERHPGHSAADLGLSLASSRTAFDRRAVVVGSDAARLIGGVRALADGIPAADVVTGTAEPGKLAFLFTGQGSQRTGMGRELYKAFPAFAAAYDEAVAALDPLLARPLTDVITNS